MITNINHSFRKEMKLTCNEYCVADYIYQNRTSNRRIIGEQLGLSKLSVIRITNRLLFLGFVEETAYKKGHLRTTVKFNRYFHIQKTAPQLKKSYIFNPTLSFKVWQPARQTV